MKKYYDSHLKPTLLYASPIWYRYDNVTKKALDKIDRRFWKLSPVTRGAVPLNTLSLNQECVLADLRMAKSMFDGRIAVPFDDFFQVRAQNNRTRATSSGHFVLPRFRNTAVRHTFKIGRAHV